MNDDLEWFAPKRFGYGTGLPLTWQGWAVLLGYLAIVLGGTYVFRNSPLAIVGIIVPATVALVVIASRTTRGGWHWRWDGRDSA